MSGDTTQHQIGHLERRGKKDLRIGVIFTYERVTRVTKEKKKCFPGKI